MAAVKQEALRQRRDDRRDRAPGHAPLDARPANQNNWSTQPETRVSFFGSGPFWAGFLVSALCAGLAVALTLSSSLQSAVAIGQQISALSVLLQPLMLVAMVWAVAFTVHRARVHDMAVSRLVRASDKLFQPSDRAIDEINNLQDAVTATLGAIEGKIAEVAERGDHLSQRLYEVFKDINQISEANHDDVKTIIEQAEERRHFLQHANLMITTEANYELERNSNNVKHVLQSLKSEIDSFMARLTKDTAAMREIVGLSASETEVVKIITEDLRTIVNSSYRVIQTAAEEGRAAMEAALGDVQARSEARIVQTGDAVVRRMQENAEAVSAQLNHVATGLEHALEQGSKAVLLAIEERMRSSTQALEESSKAVLAAIEARTRESTQLLEDSSRAILEAIAERTKASTATLEATALDANDAAMQKLNSSLADLHSRISGAVGDASANLESKLAEMLTLLDTQRVKAINHISKKMVTMPESMKAAADDAIQVIDATTEKTITAFKAAAEGATSTTRETVDAVDKRIQLVQKVLVEVQGKIEDMDGELRRSFSASADGVRKSGEETRKAIAGIKSDYMAMLSQTLVQLSALATPSESEAPEAAEAAAEDEPKKETAEPA